MTTQRIGSTPAFSGTSPSPEPCLSGASPTTPEPLHCGASPTPDPMKPPLRRPLRRPRFEPRVPSDFVRDRREPPPRKSFAPSRALALATMLFAALLLPACGGGGGGGGGTSSGLAPTTVTYATTSMSIRTDEPIAPNLAVVTGGAPTSWSVDPALPAGLSLDAADGTLSGTPTAANPSTVYTITCANGAGQASTDVTIELLWHASKSLLPQAAPTEEDYRHFLDRTHFGFSQPHFDLLTNQGLDTYLDLILNYADTTQLEQDGMTFFINDPDFPSEAGLARWWIWLATFNTNPIQESLALMWHDHFATSTSVLDNSRRHYFLDHIDLWRSEGAGNLRDLLIAMCRDNAMLDFLDGVRNNGAPGNDPNENFAREFFELFCLGVDKVYTQADIVEAARAFTGYRSRFDVTTGKSFIEFDPNRHDAGSKTVLGTTIPGQNATDDFEAMVDLTLAARAEGKTVSACAQWIVQRIVEHYCYRSPPENVIDELAALLEQSNWELAPVIKTLLASEAFFSDLAKQGIAKSPLEHALGFMRSTGMVGNPVNVDIALIFMGNRPSSPPSVDGWPADSQWFSAQSMVERSNLLHYLTVQAAGVQEFFNLDALDLLPTPTATGAELVDALTVRMSVVLSAAERAAAIQFLDTAMRGGTVLDAPFVNASLEDKESRLRSLLWILGQHPTYQVR